MDSSRWEDVKRWIPGHTVLENNEEAVSLARVDLASNFVGPETVIGISHCYSLRNTEWLDFWLNLSWLTLSQSLKSSSEYITKQLLDYSKDDLHFL